MFERFTERARDVIVFAQEEAVVLKHNYIGTEHILLGLIREEEGDAARFLSNHALTLDLAREQVLRLVGYGSGTPDHRLPFSPKAKKALELGLREALSLGKNYIGTEHLLLGLMREAEGVGANVLMNFGIDFEKLRSELLVREFTPTASPQSAQTDYSPIVQALTTKIETVCARKNMAVQEQKFNVAVKLRGEVKQLEALRRELVKTEIRAVRARKETAISVQDFDLAANLREEERKLLAIKRDLQSRRD